MIKAGANMKNVSLISVCCVVLFLTACGTKYNTVSIPVNFAEKDFKYLYLDEKLDIFLKKFGYPKVPYIVLLENGQIKVKIPQRSKFSIDQEYIGYPWCINKKIKLQVAQSLSVI